MSYDPYIRWLGEPRIILKRDGEWQFTKKTAYNCHFWTLVFVIIYMLKWMQSNMFFHLINTQLWNSYSCSPVNRGWFIIVLLLTVEILHQLGCMKPYKKWTKYQPQLVIAGFQPSTVVGLHNVVETHHWNSQHDLTITVSLSDDLRTHGDITYVHKLPR